jgi:hypothetical protein
MPFYKNQDKELLHIHIPKTGGTSITSTLVKQGVNVSFMQKASHPKYGGVPPQHMSIENIKKFFDLTKVKSFAVIRDPWHRTVSEFVWRTRSNNFDILNEWLKNILKNIKHQDFQNHFLPQCKFIAQGVAVFLYNDWGSICRYVGDSLGIEKLKVTERKQKRLDYELPNIEILDKDTKKLWKKIYQQDIELFNDRQK